MAASDLDTSGPEWTAAKIGEDVFNKQAGFAWFRTTLPASGGLHHVLTFESVDDKGTIYLNGKKLLHHEGWDSSFEVPLDAAWRTDGPNQLAVLVENVDGVGGIAGNVSLAAAASLGTEIQGWKMRGGVIPPAAGDWQTLPEPARTATPRFYRATFQGAPPAEVGPHPILRLSTQGLSTGFAWLNGHNLGRYPQKVHVDGLYLPEPWIKNGENALIVFDEDGSLPIGAKLVVESAASRTVAVWSETK
jgi:beta-galactosidase